MATKSSASEARKAKAAAIAAEIKSTATEVEAATEVEVAEPEDIKPEETVQETPVESTEEEEKSEQQIDQETPSKHKNPVSDEMAQKFEVESKSEDMFLRRTISLPSRKRVRKAFASEQIVGDEFGEIETEGQKKEKEYQLLSDSAKADKPKILLGRVRGIEPVYDSNDKILTYEAKVSLIADPADPDTRALVKQGKEDGSFYSVYIPAPMFFVYRNPDRYTGKDGMANLLREMRSRIGSLIDFVVYYIDPTDERVVGSRIRAMQLKSYRHYLDPRHKDVKPGTKCMARITYVGNYGVQADVLGAECFIPNIELSWSHINAAGDVYNVGDSIPVIVKTVDTDKTIINGISYSFVAITASAKEAHKKPIDQYGANYCVGATYDGEVVYRLTSGLYFVRLGGQIDCVCKAPAFNTPHIGQKCSVYINDKDEKGLRGSFSYLGR